MEAIVLAGGFGIRLNSVISDIPKPMAPINGKPFLEYILKYLEKNNIINRVVLSVGYKWETIKEYFGNSFNEIELIYSIEDKPLGTGGAIKRAMDKVKKNQVYIMNGDTFFDIDLKTLELKRNNKLQLSLKHMKEFDRYGCVESDKDGYVIGFTEKGYRDNGNINCGVYLSSKDIFEGYVLAEEFSFENFIHKEYKNLKITTKVFDSYFIDIGIPTDYIKAINEMNKYI